MVLYDLYKDEAGKQQNSQRLAANVDYIGLTRYRYYRFALLCELGMMRILPVLIVSCKLKVLEIGSRVGRNQTTVMRIYDSWMQEGTIDRRDRSHPPQCTTSREGRQIKRMAVTDHSATSRTIE
ncbi:transposable element Tcb1 transposase [Trichonephila clavipes]|nr:transposable element Tcb1 transposase [Trichonephila clavipes]